MRSASSQPWDAFDHIHDEVEAVEVVEHDDVEGRRRRALLLVATHVEVVVVLPSVREPVNEPWIAVIGKDDGPVGGEHGVELRIGQAVRVLALGLEAHKVDDVHDAHLELRQALAQDRRRGQRLERRDIAAAGEDDVGWPDSAV